MPDKGTVFQKGGGGTNYEQAVGTAFVVTMLINGNVPCLSSDVKIMEIAFQKTNRGYETDDILVTTKSTSTQHRLVIQVKHNLTFSYKNDVFRQVITAFWNDFNKPDIFDKNTDRLVIIKSGLNDTERKHIIPLLNIARTHTTESDFFSEIDRIQIISEKFAIFANILKDIDKTITRGCVWEFIKCLDVLDYDFSNEPSHDKINFLNIIKLAKNNAVSLNEDEIWNSIQSFVSRLNQSGGSITSENLKANNLYSYFDPNRIMPYYSSITRLLDDGDVLLGIFKNTIDDYHIPRDNYYEKISNALQGNQITFITGEPGVGKSAVVKDFLYKMFGRRGVFSFRADQFNVVHLTTVMSNQGVNISCHELLSCIALMESKIIFIDGMEKLLEGDPLNAFLQLKNSINEYPEIKIIATVRRFSLELLCKKFDIKPESIGFVFIDRLSTKELEGISDEFPKLKPVLQNNKINALLSYLKYIEFALAALNKADEDFTLINEAELKTLLWNRLVKNDLDKAGGMPKKREDAFIGIAVKRAKSMKMFIQPDNADPVAVDFLENDNIIVQNNSTGTYSPTHDILEDWALTYYVSKVFDNYPSPKELFIQLGNEPSIRRGFRLWVNEKIPTEFDIISGLINMTLDNSVIEKYWSDEMLVALFKSENCDVFVREYEKELLSNDFALLKKCIHLIRITCKENMYMDEQVQLFIPEGKIWEAIILFIEKNITCLDILRMSIIGFISDWEWAFVLGKFKRKDIEIGAKNIIIHFISQIEGNNFISLHYEEKSHIFRRLISILYNLSEVSDVYITTLVKRAWEYKRKETCELSTFYNIVIEQCLSGELPPSGLVKHMPDLVIDTAWKEWKLILEDCPSSEKRYGIPSRRFLNHYELWGIKNEMRFSPASIYKTPFYFMLMTNPLKAIKFIINFLNYSVEFYVNSDTSDYKHDITQIDMVLNDGSIIKQWSGEALWLAYRGLSVTNDLIESLLLSLEKYLLECISNSVPSAEKYAKFLFEYILMHSNNIMTASVLASVSMAYPQCVGESMLPILRVKEFYFFDLTRSANEYSALSIMDSKIPYAQKEKHEFNKLPHRTKYARGLMNFIIDYQVSIRTINDKIFHLLDDLKSKDDKSNELWSKTLTEIDIRNYVVEKNYDAGLGGYPLAVHYEESLAKHLTAGKNLVQGYENTLKITIIVNDAYKTERSIKYSQWLDCYNYYINSETINKLYDRYCTLAAIGLRDFESNLTRTQKVWCISILSQAIKEIVSREINHGVFLNYSFNALEEDVVLSSLHLLLKFKNNKTKKNAILLFFIILICNISSDKEKILTEYLRNIFSNIYPNEFDLILICLIKYSQYLYENKETYHKTRMNDTGKLREEENSFLYSTIESGNMKFDAKMLKFDYFNYHVLCRALIIIPIDKISKKYLSFMKTIIEKILIYLNQEKKYDQDYFSLNKERLNIKELLSVYSFTANVLLSSDIKISKQIIDILFSIPLSFTDMQEETEEFIGQILNSVVLELSDEWSQRPDSQSFNEHFKNFWNLWEYLFRVLKSKSSDVFSNKLLLDIPYLCYDFQGRPYKKRCDLVKGKKELYGEMVATFGMGNLLTIITIFTNIGMPSLFPDCINWIVDICKRSESETRALTANVSITMVKELFYNYMTDIARNKALLNNYIWILDKMIDMGISEAYFLRENVITFKNVGGVYWY